jgi:hypothetical protein
MKWINPTSVRLVYKILNCGGYGNTKNRWYAVWRTGTELKKWE